MSIICSINKELSFWFKHAELRYWAIPEIRYTSPKEDMEIPPKFYQHFAQEIKTRGGGGNTFLVAKVKNTW